MRVIIVRIGDVKLYPPTISLINILSDLGHECILISTNDSKGVEKALKFNVSVHYINYTYDENKSIFVKAIDLSHIKKMLWDKIDEVYESDSLLWIESDISIKHLGKKLLNYRYILQMDELNDGIYYSARFKQFKMDAALIGNNAKAVIVPEYNRAHITKAWWGLEKMPYILPNKPYLNEDEIADLDIPEQAKKILVELKDKKIIIYQGGLGKERPIFKFVEAVEELPDFAFVIMSSNYSEYTDKGYKNCYFIDYMVPPMHLKVTKHAYIGVVMYMPTQGQNSMLNALYCAPNKIFEYARYGIPTIGNDIPGLKSVANEYHNGVVLLSVEINQIKNAINHIENNYDQFSKNAKEMYDFCDNKRTVKKIISEIQ